MVEVGVRIKTGDWLRASGVYVNEVRSYLGYWLVDKLTLSQINYSGMVGLSTSGALSITRKLGECRSFGNNLLARGIIVNEFDRTIDSSEFI